MPVLFRCVRNVAAILALLLCVAIVGVWVRSYHVTDEIGRIHYAPEVESEDHHVWFISSRGNFNVIGGGFPAELFPDVCWRYQKNCIGPGLGLRGPQTLPYLRWTGISWLKPTRLSTGEWWWYACVPAWLPAVISGLAGATLVRPWRWLRRRPKAGACVRCGYDLRASPERCPECGNEVRLERKTRFGKVTGA